MLNENLKALRKAKGITQEELAVRLNVVRQTISKWEKGFSVPDAAMLIRIADIFELPVSELLGSKVETESDVDGVAEQLSRINEQLAIKNRRGHRIMKIVLGTVIAIVTINIVLVIVGIVAFDGYNNNKNISVTKQIEEVHPDK